MAEHGQSDGPSSRRLAAVLRVFQHVVSAAVVPHDFGPPSGLGFRCVKPVKAGGVLLEVSAETVVTTETAREAVLSELGVSAEALPEVTPQDYFCLWLLLEKARGSASKLADYMKTLPEDITEMSAAFWPTSALSELEGCEAQVRLIEIKEVIEEAYGRVANAVAMMDPQVREVLLPILDRDGYVWARCILNSRQFEGTFCTETEFVGVLVPVVDLFNHSCNLPAGQCIRRDTEGVIQIIALRDFDQGEEALISYGRVGSPKLLLRGFAVDDNPDESYELVMGVRCSPARLSWLQQAQGENAHDEFEWREHPSDEACGAEAQITIRRRNPLPNGLVHLARLECCRDDYLTAVSSGVNGKYYEFAPLGLECEKVALMRLQSVAQALLNKFGHPQEACENEEASIVVLRKMAVVAREGEKAVLADFAEAVQSRMIEISKLAETASA